MELTDRFEVTTEPQKVWNVFWDLPRVAMCLPGCETIEMVDDRHYKAVMAQRVGPFQVKMDIDLSVDQITQGRSVVVSGSGKDRMGNRLKLTKLELAIEQAPTGSNVSYIMEFNLFGRLASLGNSVIKRKAEEIRQEFTRRMMVELQAIE